MMKLSATAHVSVLVEVHISRPWDATTAAETIHKQASEEATAVLRRLTDKESALRIIGDPQVRMIITEKKE